MRFFSLLSLIVIFICSNAFAAKPSSQQGTIAILANWQVTVDQIPQTGMPNVILWIKSDNDIPANDPDNPQQLPVTMSVTCSKKTGLEQPLFTILYPNMVFDTATQSLTFIIDGVAQPAVTAGVKKQISGNSSGFLMTFDTKTGDDLLNRMKNHHSLAVAINRDGYDIYNGKFTIDKTAEAVTSLNYCTGKK